MEAMLRWDAEDVQFLAKKHGTGEIVHNRARQRGKTMRHVYSAALYLAMPFFFARLPWRGLRNPAYWRRLGERIGRTNGRSALLGQCGWHR